jgi:hypothetical protein
MKTFPAFAWSLLWMTLAVLAALIWLIMLLNYIDHATLVCTDCHNVGRQLECICSWPTATTGGH